MRSNGTVRLVVASVLGALVACFVCWISCYLLAKANIGFFAGNEQITTGRSVISRAALNVYTIQHVPLTGSGTISDATESKQDVSARIVLPYSVWTLIPIIALLIAFAFVMRTAGVEKRSQALVAALLTSLIYALILTAFAGFVHSPMDSVPIPEISGTSISPPAVDFTPSTVPAFAYCLLLGACCAFVSWILPGKQKGLVNQTGFWHPCVASVVFSALLIGIILSLGIWFVTRTKASNSGMGNVELVPAAATTVYSGLFGASVSAKADSEMSLGGGKTTLFGLNANLYGNTTQNDGKKTETKAIPKPVKYGACALAAVLGFFAAILAVKKGSRDGSLTTTARILFCQLIIIAILILTTRLELVSSMKSGEFISTTSVIAAVSFSWKMLLPMIIFGIGSMIGAQMARKSLRLKFDIDNI